MKEFFKKLIGDSSEVSHKRTIALGSFLVLIGFAISNQFGIKTDEVLINTFLMLAGGSSVLTVVDKFVK